MPTIFYEMDGKKSMRRRIAELETEMVGAGFEELKRQTDIKFYEWIIYGLTGCNRDRIARAQAANRLLIRNYSIALREESTD